MTKEQNDYWKMIDEIGWGRKTTDYTAIAREWFKRLGKDGMEAFDKFVSARVTELQNAIKKYEDEHGQLDIGSDDGFSDVTHHVVGLGFLEWQKACKNPKLVEQRYNSKYGTFEGYRESFSYCFQEPMAEPSIEDQVAALRKQQDNYMAEIQRLTEVCNGLSERIFELRRKEKEGKK